MQEFPKSLFCTLRAVGRFVVLGGVVSVSVPASLGNAQIAPDMPNPIVAPNPLTRTLSIFRLNMQDKIAKAAEMMPESKYSYRPTKEVRSFGETSSRHIRRLGYGLLSLL